MDFCAQKQDVKENIRNLLCTLAVFFNTNSGGEKKMIIKI
jgi:hypothetical protein